MVALTFDAGANSAGLPEHPADPGRDRCARHVLPHRQLGGREPGGSRRDRGGRPPAGQPFDDPSGLHRAPRRRDRGPAVGEPSKPSGPAEGTRGHCSAFPFGERDARTIATVNAHGYLPVRWTVDTLGWKGSSGGVTAQIVADRVLSRLQPGEIVLMHIGSNPDDGTTLDADALPGMIERIRQAGYAFTTLEALLG